VKKLPDLWYANLDAVLARIRSTQEGPIREAAQRIVTAVTGGGLCHLYDTGHMLMYELIGRAGGILIFTPIFVELALKHPARYRPPDEQAGSAAAKRPRVHMDEVEGMASYVLSQADCRPGDVLVLGSVAGVSRLAVDLALEARAMGLYVIALTSRAASSAVASRHPSGKRLYEVADLVLDQQTPPGDAIVPLPDAEPPICPASGIAAAYLMWALTAQIVEDLRARGLTPGVLMSNHLPGASEHNRRARLRYQEVGY